MEEPYHIDSNTLIYASQEQDGAIAYWIAINRPFTCDIVRYECLERWVKIHSPEKKAEKKFLEDFFTLAKSEGRLIVTNWLDASSIYSARAFMLQSYGIKVRDSFIATVAEHHQQILLTADTKKDFAPRLEKLNQQGLGHFLLQTYPYLNREETFKRWNESGQ